MADKTILHPPPDGGWLKFEQADFEALAGPFYWSSEAAAQNEMLRMGFRVEAKHCNPQKTCHGGMMATFLDMALGFSMRSATRVVGPTMTLAIDYLDPALIGDWIESRPRLVHATEKTGYCDVVAVGPRGPVARANGVFRIL